MSASEKLRALDASFPPAPFTPTAAWSSFLSLRTALPLIADCIEAAEAQDEPSKWLINSLDALTEHLEGGDLSQTLPVPGFGENVEHLEGQ